MDFVSKIRQIIKLRHDDVVVAMTSGNVEAIRSIQIWMNGSRKTNRTKESSYPSPSTR